MWYFLVGCFKIIVNLFLEDKETSWINKSYFLECIKFLNRRIDRHKDKNPEISREELYRDQPGILNAINKSKSEVERMGNELEKAENGIEFKNIPMGASIQGDPKMLSFVKAALAKCNALEAPSSPEQTKTVY